MKLLIQKVKWSLRRITIRIPSNALVLEVGSGGNPYPRSNVLCDAYEVTRERHWEDMVHDRPTILSFGENLPFKDQAFDYVIAAHVLEHTPFPEKFLGELQRVSRAGFIETPDAFMERINPYKDHRLEVTVRDDTLYIRKKPAWISDTDLVELYEKRAKIIIACETIPRHAAAFHMRYFWKDAINFKVVNPEVDANWPSPDSFHESAVPDFSIKSKLRSISLHLFRRIFSQRIRNASLDILPLLRCPKCHSEQLARDSALDIIVCQDCGASFSAQNNIYRIL